MNIHEVIEHLEEALKTANKIKYEEVAKVNLENSINGIGDSFPDNKKEWEIQLKRTLQKVDDYWVDLKMRINAIK